MAATQHDDDGHSLDDSYESASTIGTPPPPPVSGKSLTIPLIIFFLLRLILLGGIFGLWGFNVIVQFEKFNTGIKGYIPSTNSSIWSKLHLTSNRKSLLEDLFYPPKKSELNFLRVPKHNFKEYFRVTAGFSYAFELVILSPLVLVGIFIGRKTLKVARILCRTWIVLLVIPCIVVYIVGAVNFCVFKQFITVYWIDMGLLFVFIVLMAIRLRWMSSLINHGYKKIPSPNAVDPEVPNDPSKIIHQHHHHHIPEEELKKDPDYQILFINMGDGRENPGTATPSATSMPTPTPSSSAIPSGVTTPATSTEQLKPPDPASAPPSNPEKPSESHTSESHVVEKHTTTTIIQAMPTPTPQVVRAKASKKKEKKAKSKKKKKKKSKKKKKKK